MCWVRYNYVKKLISKLEKVNKEFEIINVYYLYEVGRYFMVREIKDGIIWDYMFYVFRCIGSLGLFGFVKKDFIIFGG